MLSEYGDIIGCLPKVKSAFEWSCQMKSLSQEEIVKAPIRKSLYPKVITWVLKMLEKLIPRKGRINQALATLGAKKGWEPPYEVSTCAYC